MTLADFDMETAKAVGVVIAACGGLASTVIAAMNRKSSKGNGNELRGLTKAITEMRGDIAGLRTEFTEHRAGIVERVTTLEREMGRLRDAKHTPLSRDDVTAAMFEAIRMAKK